MMRVNVVLSLSFAHTHSPSLFLSLTQFLSTHTLPPSFFHSLNLSLTLSLWLSLFFSLTLSHPLSHKLYKSASLLHTHTLLFLFNTHTCTLTFSHTQCLSVLPTYTHFFSFSYTNSTSSLGWNGLCFSNSNGRAPLRRLSGTTTGGATLRRLSTTTKSGELFELPTFFVGN